MVQTEKKKYIFPVGMNLSISTDSGSTYTDIGTFEGGIELTHRVTKVEVENDYFGQIGYKIKSQNVLLKPSTLWTWDLNNVSVLSGGYIDSSSSEISSVNVLVDESGNYLVDGSGNYLSDLPVSVSGTKITAGDEGKIDISNYTIRLRHYTDSIFVNYDIEAFIYGASANGSIGYSFKGENSNGLNEITVEFVCNGDVTETDKLLSIDISDSILIT